MKSAVAVLCVVSALLLGGCGGGSSDKSGICVSPRPSDAAIAKALDSTLIRSRGVSSDLGITVLAVSDCDANGNRIVWYNYEKGQSEYSQVDLRHADNGKWYVMRGNLVEVSKD